MSVAPETRGLSCPRCAGSISPGSDLDQLACGYCGFAFLLSGEREVQAYTPLGRIGRRRAIRELQRVLVDIDAGGHVVESATLHYLPFWDLSAKLVGWQRYRKRVASKHSRLDKFEYTESAHIELAEEAIGRDINQSTPACDVRGFGMIGVADRLRSLKLRPFQLDRLEDHESACTVMKPRSVLMRGALLYHQARLMPADARHPRQRFSLIRPRIRLIYYPVWRLRYTASGLQHEAVIDGVKSRLVKGSYPVEEKDSLLPWLAAGGVGGFVAGLSIAASVMGLLAWSVSKMMRDGVRGRSGEMASWFNRQISGSRIVIRDISR